MYWYNMAILLSPLPPGKHQDSFCNCTQKRNLTFTELTHKQVLYEKVNIRHRGYAETAYKEPNQKHLCCLLQRGSCIQRLICVHACTCIGFYAGEFLVGVSSVVLKCAFSIYKKEIIKHK